MKRLMDIVFVLLVMVLGTFVLFGRKEEQKVIKAVKADEPLQIDGFLKEQVWQGDGYSDFIQSEPLDGTPATEKTMVWVAYDEKAIYVAARLYDSAPDKIIGRLARRDEFVNSDWFILSIDPYYDRRSGYEFAINPSGSIADYTLYNDEEKDSKWDGVWESKTFIDDNGWTAEMRIPFDQMRFKRKKEQVWGVNFRRIIKRKNEKLSFVWIPREESGYVSHFAKLVGIKGAKPGRFIEMLPFTAGGAGFKPEEEGNPFETGEEYTADAGIDVKMALKANLTLDLTLNPDFGEVEVDPALINLTPVETYYDEKRPFFIEGADIFRFGRGGANRFLDPSWKQPDFFYSRRIGRSPQGSATSPGYVDYPSWTTILAAAKLTGKVGNEWNIGFISAITEREYAEIDLEGHRSYEEVEPFTYYGVLRAQKEFKEGRQGLGFITTAVLRNLRSETLENSLKRDAFSFAMDGWTFLDKKKTWVVTGWFGGTRVSGSKTAIRILQHSYPFYFQRPDTSHVKVDENATSMSGWAGRFSINKQRGNFLFNASIAGISPGFDSSDLGFLWYTDRICAHAMVGYRWFKPGKILRYWDLQLLAQKNYDFGGNKIWEQGLILTGNAMLLNYWGAYFRVSVNPEAWLIDDTRGGPLVYYHPNKWGELVIYSDNRKPVVFTMGFDFLDVENGSHIWILSPSMNWKPSANFNLSISPRYHFNHNVCQWVSNVKDEFMTDTYETRYIFAEIDQKMLSCVIRLNWSFTPRLSLQAYIQPFIAVGTYDQFKELARPRSFDFNVYGEGNSTIYQENRMYSVDPDGPGQAPAFSFYNPNFNYKSLRGTIVLRWEYRPGSILYFVWTQVRSDYSNPGDFKFGRDFKNLLKAPGDNIFMVKFTYRFKI